MNDSLSLPWCNSYPQSADTVVDIWSAPQPVIRDVLLSNYTEQEQLTADLSQPQNPRKLKKNQYSILYCVSKVLWNVRLLLSHPLTSTLCTVSSAITTLKFNSFAIEYSINYMRHYIFNHKMDWVNWFLPTCRLRYLFSGCVQ